MLFRSRKGFRQYRGTGFRSRKGLDSTEHGIQKQEGVSTPCSRAPPVDCVRQGLNPEPVSHPVGQTDRQTDSQTDRERGQERERARGEGRRKGKERPRGGGLCVSLEVWLTYSTEHLR